jgi:hypothetical protein
MDAATKDTLLAFFICTIPFGLLLGFVLLWRYMRHREVLRMLELGISPPAAGSSGAPAPAVSLPPLPSVPPPPSSGRALLAWGLVLVGVGLAFTLALWPIGLIIEQEAGIRLPLGLGPWMLVGFVPLFLGLALTLTYVLTRTGPPRFYAPEAMPPIEPTSPAPPENLPPSGPQVSEAR